MRLFKSFLVLCYLLSASCLLAVPPTPAKPGTYTAWITTQYNYLGYTPLGLTQVTSFGVPESFNGMFPDPGTITVNGFPMSRISTTVPSNCYDGNYPTTLYGMPYEITGYQSGAGLNQTTVPLYARSNANIWYLSMTLIYLTNPIATSQDAIWDSPKRSKSSTADPIDTATGIQVQTIPMAVLPGALPIRIDMLRDSQSTDFQCNWNQYITAYSGTYTLWISNQEKYTFTLDTTGTYGSGRYIPLPASAAYCPGFIQTSGSTTLIQYVGSDEAYTYTLTGSTYRLTKYSKNGLNINVSGTGTIFTDQATGNTATITSTNATVTGQTNVAQFPTAATPNKAVDIAGNEFDFVISTTNTGTGLSYTFNEGGTSTPYLYKNKVNDTFQIITQTDALAFSTSLTYQASSTNGTIITGSAIYSNTNCTLTTVTDRRGNNWVWNHDSYLNLLYTTTPLGNTTSYTYDTNNRVTSITDPASYTTNYTYSYYGQPCTITDALSNTTAYSYDGTMNLLAVTDRMGGTTTIGRDSSGRIISITDALGNTWSSSLNTNGQVVSYQDPLGNSGTNTYTSGNLTAATDRDGNTTNYTYAATGYVNYKTDPASNITKYSFDPMGRPTSIITPASGTYLAGWSMM